MFQDKLRATKKTQSWQWRGGVRKKKGGGEEQEDNDWDLGRSPAEFSRCLAEKPVASAIGKREAAMALWRVTGRRERRDAGQ